jgi:hypothetical protein
MVARGFFVYSLLHGGQRAGWSERSPIWKDGTNLFTGNG